MNRTCIDAKLCFGVNLIDILSAGAAGSGKSEAQFRPVGPDTGGQSNARQIIFIGKHNPILP